MSSNSSANPIQTEKLSSVSRRKIEYLWFPYIAKSSITNITGDPGIGKGFLTAEIAAKVSSGGMLPGMDTPIEASNVLILAQEDDAETVLRPRLEDAGADLDRIHVYTGYSSATRTGFDISKINELFTKIQELNAGLVIFDPLVDFFREDINRTERVKALVAPLHDLAKKLKISIISVIHCNKADVKALYKGAGSVQFAGQARSVLFLEQSPDPEATEDKVVCHVKCNGAKKAESRVFTVDHLDGDSSRPILKWHPEKEGIWAADDLLGIGVGLRGQPSKLDLAKGIVFGATFRGSFPSSRIEELAQELGVSDSTLGRAYRDLRLQGIDKKQVYENDQNHWITFWEGHDDERQGLRDGNLSPEDEALARKVAEYIKKLLPINDGQGNDGQGPAGTQDAKGWSEMLAHLGIKIGSINFKKSSEL